MTMHKEKDLKELLTPYQDDCVNWLVREKRGLLALEPGVGKTLTTLATIDELGLKRILVVAPASVCGVWPLEISKWLGDKLPVTILRGTPAKRGLAYEQIENGFYIISYETVRSDIVKLLAIKWDAIVLDETIKLQTPTSKTVKAVMKLHADVRIALNGTPISNGWADIWATFEWLERGSLYGNYYSFRNYHAVMSPHVPGMILGWRDTERIKKRTAHLMKRITKQEALKDLPAIMEQTIPVELGSAELKVYRGIKEDLLLKLPDVNVPIENALVELIRLRQTVNGLFHFPDLGKSDSAKLDVALELLGQVARAGKKAIVFTGFKVTALELERRFKKEFAKENYQSRLIIGDVSQEDREQNVQDLWHDPNVTVLIGTDAMATGLNLQCASYVINIDLPYSYAKYEQRIGRAWRMGQTESVTVWNLEATGTVDARVASILSKKVATSGDFTGDVERVSLSREEIINLIN